MKCPNVYCIARDCEGDFFDECPARINYETDNCPTGEEYNRLPVKDETLNLPIKTIWLNMIAADIKKEEYREIKPYWTKRLMDGDKFKEFDTVKFHNYGKDPPVIAGFIKIHIGEGRHVWGAEKGKKYYVITIDSACQDLPF